MARRSYVCEICTESISVSRYRRHGICSRQRCRVAWTRAFWKRVRKGKLSGRRDMQLATKVLVPSAKRVVGDADGDYLPVVVPTNSRRIINLPEKRKRAFRDHLMLQISVATSHRNPPNDAVDLPHAPQKVEETNGLPLMLHACATCQGHCCKPGYNSALISRRTISRFMREKPSMRPRDVLQAYLSRLPSKSYENSCVYHTADGCALPRQMRSATCNSFLCPNLEEVQRQLAKMKQPRLLVISAASKVPERAAYVDGSEIVRGSQ